MSDITIANPLDALIVALPAALSERATLASAALDDALARFANGITNAADFDAAGEAYRSAQKLEKDIEKARKDAKAPVLDLGRALDAAADAATRPLSDARNRLGLVIGDYQTREAKRVAEERAAAARAIAEQAAEQARQRAEAARATLAAEPQLPLPVAPIVIPPKVEAAPKSVVRMVTKYSLRVTAAERIPRKVYDDADNVYSLMVLDEAAAIRALRAGVTINGCELVTEEVPAAIGR